MLGWISCVSDRGRIASSSIPPPPLLSPTFVPGTFFPCPRGQRYEEAERIEEMLKNGSLEEKVTEKEAVAA